MKVYEVEVRTLNGSREEWLIEARAFGEAVEKAEKKITRNSRTMAGWEITRAIRLGDLIK